MKVKEFQSLEASYPDAVILVESGAFYKTYGACAFILAWLMGYQLIEVADTCRSGFPKASLKKVEDALAEARVSYVVFQGDKKVFEQVFKDTRFHAVYDESLYIGEIHKKMKPAGEHPKGTDSKETRQSILIVDGCGVNENDALISLKTHMEQEVLQNGYRIISASFITKQTAATVLMQSLVVCEK
jgi:hypothetical protein